MIMDATAFGICICVEGELGRIASLYFKFGQLIELRVGSNPLIVGTDGNAFPLFGSLR